MSIAKGDHLPAGHLQECTDVDLESGCPLNPKTLDILDACKGKTIILFGVPGAFTPTCSQRHLPGFIDHAEALIAAGADDIWCMSVNDAFVMAAWGHQISKQNQVRMLGDGSAAYTRLLGLERDLSQSGMGIRCKRFAMIVRDAVVSYIGVEGSGEFGVSSAEAVLAALRNPS